MIFGRKSPNSEERAPDTKDGLVEALLAADEVERKRLLLVALQSGEIKRSEVDELLRLVERLERVSR